MNKMTACSIRVALWAAVLVLGAAHARPTQKCNTLPTTQLQVGGMTAAQRSHLLATVADPSIDPALYAALWEPRSAAASTGGSLLSPETAALQMDPFQDLAEITQAMQGDAVLAAAGVSASEPLSIGACFATGPPGGPYSTVVTEYHNTVLDHYFLSSSSEENAIIDGGGAGAGWQRTGETFTAATLDFCGTLLPVFRFYGRPANSHFFTADAEECGFLRNHDPGWVGEGVAFLARLPVNGVCAFPLVPVYRAYNQRAAFNDPNHRYMTRFDLYLQMMSRGWAGEGVAMCVAGTR